jgi:hypothetical protein
MNRISKWCNALCVIVISSSALAQDAHSELAQMLVVQQSKAMKTMFSSGVLERMQSSMRQMISADESDTATAATEKLQSVLEKFNRNAIAAMQSPETTKPMKDAI